MSLNIKSPSAVQAVRELAALTGESMTSAIEAAAREKIELVLADRAKATPRPSAALADDIRALQEIFAVDGKTRQEIDDELYDESGLPR